MTLSQDLRLTIFKNYKDITLFYALQATKHSK